MADDFIAAGAGDPRLLPFIEVLAELGMDWLAFELVDGVRRGKEPLEDEAALRRARDIVGSATTLIAAAGRGRLFELYVMTGIALALEQRSYEVWIRRSDGSRVAPNDAQREFVQRGGVPAGIPPASVGPGEASSIVFSRHGPEWEMLNGVTFEGRSQALHEIDIAIVPGPVVASRRNGGGGSPTGATALAQYVEAEASASPQSKRGCRSPPSPRCSGTPTSRPP